MNKKLNPFYQKSLDPMTRSILHAIKKLLRVGVVVVTVTSGSINASAQGIIPDLCSTSCKENNSPYQLVNYNNNSIPSATDNCGTPTLTYQSLEGNYNYSNPNFFEKNWRV